MKTAIVTLSEAGLKVAQVLKKQLSDCDVYVHENVFGEGEKFSRIEHLVTEVFDLYKGLVFIVPTGVAVRAITPCIHHKTTDPAVVVMDVGARYVISLLSGHEGGANQLAIDIANFVNAEPVITTTSEAIKNVIVGIGCRRSIKANTILKAIEYALAKGSVAIDEVRLLATVDLKKDERGILDTAKQLGIPLRIIGSDTIRTCNLIFQHSAFVEQSVGLPAVAEPVALLAGRRTSILLPKITYQGVTIALARENCFSLE